MTQNRSFVQNHSENFTGNQKGLN